MAKKHRPRKGSLAFRPRKRADSIYQTAHSYREGKGVLGFAAFKAGMLQVAVHDTRKNSPTSGKDITVPATILECPRLFVAGMRLYGMTHYGLKAKETVWSEKAKEEKHLSRKTGVSKPSEVSQDSFEEVRIIVSTRPEKTGIGRKKPDLFEIKVGGSPQDALESAKKVLGNDISPSDIFREGDLLDAIAVTKGKGFQGVITRFGVKRQRRKAMGKRRHIGTLGSETPRKVPWTAPQCGQVGFQRRTEANKEVIKIGTDGSEVTPKEGLSSYGVVRNDYIIIKGSLPGPKKRLVFLRKAVRPSKSSPLQFRNAIV